MTRTQVRRRAFFAPRTTFDVEVSGKSLWRNLVLLNNQMDLGGCFATTWSLCVQMQFYAVFPLALLLLRPHRPGFR
jgi:peptidoglycan/LPS O-acetylase OafA/YrhL